MDTNQPLQNLTVGELAGKDYRFAQVFQHYRIDFCCGGEQSLEQAARSAGITEEELRSALQLAELDKTVLEKDYQRWTTGELIDHIVETHHRYIRETTPVLLEYARKVANHHGSGHAELIQLELLLRRSLQDLLGHLDIEEQVLFPAIKRLIERSEETSIGNSPLVSLAIDQMQTEHRTAGEDLQTIREITDNYRLPDGACNSYRYLYQKLQEFDLDLQLHIHLENNILFPAALAATGLMPTY